MEVKQILVDAVKKGASDIFIITGARLAYKIDNKVTPQEGQPLMPSDTKADRHRQSRRPEKRNGFFLFHCGDGTFQGKYLPSAGFLFGGA